MMCVCGACMHVSVLSVYLVPVKARRGHQIPWNSWLRATTCMPLTKPVSIVRTERVLSSLAISLAAPEANENNTFPLELCRLAQWLVPSEYQVFLRHLC